MIKKWLEKLKQKRIERAKKILQKLHSPSKIKVLTVSGKAEHGKDKTAEIICKELQLRGKKVLVLHYGDYVKFVCEKYFGWNGKKDEEGRTILQKIGTDIVRVRRPTFWVDVLVMLMDVFAADFDYFIIPDTRFPNEINTLKQNGFNTIAVHVERLNFVSSLTPEQLQHASETALDNYEFDYYIKANSGVENLELEVNRFLTWLTFEER